jgi:hypothetical protein
LNKIRRNVGVFSGANRQPQYPLSYATDKQRKRYILEQAGTSFPKCMACHKYKATSSCWSQEINILSRTNHLKFRKMQFFKLHEPILNLIKSNLFIINCNTFIKNKFPSIKFPEKKKQTNFHTKI